MNSEIFKFLKEGGDMRDKFEDRKEEEAISFVSSQNKYEKEEKPVEEQAFKELEQLAFEYAGWGVEPDIETLFKKYFPRYFREGAFD